MRTYAYAVEHLVVIVSLAQGLASCGGDVVRVRGGTGGAPSFGGGDFGIGGAGVTGGATSMSTSTVAGDPWLLSSGDSNAIATGGYWWTYTDHNGDSSVYHSHISQMTSLVVALQPTVDSDPAHGQVISVSGAIPPALPWTLVSALDPSTIDKYWQAIYPDSEIPAYPAAGVAFGFQRNNALYDGTHGGTYVGVAFDMKANLNMPLVYVSMLDQGTALPDPNFLDAFPKRCQYYTATNTIVNGGASCFAFYRKGLFSTSSSATLTAYNTMAAVGVWKRYCVLYSEMAAPDWASAATLAVLSPFNPTQLVGVSWDMYQPPEGGTASNFDISIDNVSLVTAAEARNSTNDCDPSKI